MEHLRALAALIERPAPEHRRIAAALGLEEAASPAAYADLFLFQLYPYASVYLGAEGMLGGESRDRIAGFWRALELVPPDEPDHLSVMLALHARLVELECAANEVTRPVWRRARHAHYWEHLMSWLPAWLTALDAIAPPPYRAWGRLLESTLAEEGGAIGAPAALPRHLAEAPALSDPRAEGLEPFVVSLLAPVRSGIIVTRGDLARAAADLGLGLRAGERRYALRALLSQDAPATFDWLRAAAAQWTARHDAARAWRGLVADHWVARASRTAELLGQLRNESMEVLHATGIGDERRCER